MAYDPISPQAYYVGLPRTAAVWGRLIDNHNNLATDYQPPILQVGSGLDDPLVVADTADTTLSTSYDTYLRWLVPRDQDDQIITTRVIWRSPTGGATLRISCGGASSVTIGSGASYTVSEIAVSPSGTAGAAPLLGREMTLDLKAATANPTTVEIISVACYCEPAAVPTGVQASNWIKMPALADDVDEPIPSERVQRLLSGPVYIAQDRPVCVASVIQDTRLAATGTGSYGTASTSWRSVARWVLPPSHPGSAGRTYAVAAYIQGSAAWEASIHVGSGSPIALSGSTTGWYYGTFSMAAGMPQSGLVKLHWLLGGGGMPVTLHTLQVFQIDTE